MNIQTISKEKKEVMVELTADDLGIICNALYAQLGEKKHNDTFMQLYSDMMMARDLCQYGLVDDFCLHNIVKCRSRFRGVVDIGANKVNILKHSTNIWKIMTCQQLLEILILCESISGLLETCKTVIHLKAGWNKINNMKR